MIRPQLLNTASLSRSRSSDLIHSNHTKQFLDQFCQVSMFSLLNYVYMYVECVMFLRHFRAVVSILQQWCIVFLHVVKLELSHM